MSIKVPKITRENEFGETKLNLPFEIEIQLGKEWLQLYEKWCKKDLMCVRCGDYYKEIENIGSWKCKQHAREWNSITDGHFYPHGSWDCCGDRHRENKVYARGCVAADHNFQDESAFEKPIHDVLIPVALFKYLKGVKKEAVLNSNQLTEYEIMSNRRIPREYMVIRRYDDLEDKSRKEYGHSSTGKTIVCGQWIEKRYTSMLGVK